jgi:putative mRNA 3-end processing factor
VTYTGDLNLEASSTAEAAQVAECDTLVLESTFGHPRYRFPPKAEVLEAIEAFARTTLERGATPVLLGYSLGKSQEVIRALTSRGHSVVAHASVCAVAEVYRSLGVEVGAVRRFDGTWLPDEVGVFPPHVWKFERILRPWPRRTAILTGWAVDGGTARRYGADEAFPLSDHADFEGLLSYARSTGASEVLTHHGFAEELARALRDRGIDARPLGTVRQLDLFG